MTQSLVEIVGSFLLVIAAALFFAAMPILGDVVVMAATGVASLLI